MALELPKISIKWKIFLWCFSLAIGDRGLQLLVRDEAGAEARPATRRSELQGDFTRYQSFERAIAHGMAAAASVWASSPQLRAAFAKGDDEAAKPVVAQVEQSLAQTLQPAFIVLVDRHGDVTTPGALDASAARSLRAVADLRQGMSIDDAHPRASTAAPTSSPGEPVIAQRRVGRRAAHRRAARARVRRIQASDRRRSEEAGRAGAGAQPRTTASAAHERRLGRHGARHAARGARDDQRRRREGPGAAPARRAARLLRGAAQRLRRARRWARSAASSSCATASSATQRMDDHHPRQRSSVAAVALALAALVAFGISIVVTRPIRQFIDATARSGARRRATLTRRLQVRAATPAPRCTSSPTT